MSVKCKLNTDTLCEKYIGRYTYHLMFSLTVLHSRLSQTECFQYFLNNLSWNLQAETEICPLI